MNGRTWQVITGRETRIYSHTVLPETRRAPALSVCTTWGVWCSEARGSWASQWRNDQMQWLDDKTPDLIDELNFHEQRSRLAQMVNM